MRITREQEELLTSLKSDSRETLDRTLQKYKWRLKEIYGKILPVEEVASRQHPFREDGLCAVHVCALYGYLSSMEELKEQLGEQIIHQATKKNGWTPLHFAAYGGHQEMWAWLAERSTNLDVCTKDGWSPLNIAIANGNSKLALAMIQGGRDINIRSPKGNSSLHLSVECLGWVNSNYDTAGRAEVIKALLGKGALLRAINEANETPLHVCLRNQLGPIVLAALLTASDAQTTVSDANNLGQTALHLVASVDTLDLLLSAGCVLNAQGADGRTALHVHSSDPALVQKLLTKGANPDIVDKQGRTPLHVSLTKENVQLPALQALIATMTNINVQDNGKNTALHVACSYRYNNLQGSKFRDPALELLIRGGMMINLQNNRGETALHLAIRSSQYVKAGMLVRAGANVDLLDHKGASPRNMDTKWITRIMYEDPLDTRSRSNLSARSSRSTHSNDRSPRGDKAEKYGNHLKPAAKSSPAPSPKPLLPRNIDQLLARSEDIDELALQLGVSMEESAEDDENNENRARLQSQISSLRDEMTSLHDILEGYTMSPSSPPISIAYTAPSVASDHLTERGQFEEIEEMDLLADILEDNVIST